MSKFKVGDLARCTKSTGSPPEYTVGKIYKVSDVYMDRICTELDDRGSDTNGWGEEHFEKVTEPKFKVGDRVFYVREFDGNEKRFGTVKFPCFDGTEVWADWDESGGVGWMPADRVFADKTRGQIISELRKAAGLPAFVVGDVVKILDNKSPAGNTKLLEVGEQTTIISPAIVVSYGWMLLGSGSFFFTEKQLELVSPAPATATSEPRSTERAFVVDQWVRVIDGEQIAQVTEDDGDDEEDIPYRVDFLDGDYGYFDAADLIPWIPHVGERVWLNPGYERDHGTVTRLDLSGMKFYAAWDDGNGNDSPFPIEHISPSDKPAPRKPLKKGDRVAYLGNLFIFNMPKGALATLYENQEGSTIRVKWDTRGGAFDGAYNVAGFELTALATEAPEFKRGDVVEVVKPGILRIGTKVGDLGIIVSDHSMLLNHQHDGIINQLYNVSELKLAA